MADVLLIIIGIILMFVGLVGCVLPGLPGPPLSFVGLLLLHFTEKYQFTTNFLFLWAALTVVVTLLENIIPAWGARKFGGSKRAVWGSMIGLVLGFFIFPPWGIIILPFVGAVVGELTAGKDTRDALRAGFGAFAGIFAGIIIKLIASGMMLFYFFKKLIAG